MYEKALIAVFFMYAAGFSLLTMQYIFGDVYGFTLTNAEGIPIKSSLLTILDVDFLNQVTLSLANTNDTRNSTLSAIENAYEIGLNAGFELVTLLTGTYIFNVLYLMGIPPIMIAGMVILYMFLVARAILAYVRGL